MHLFQRARERTLRVEPGPLAFCWVEVQAERRTFGLENVPHFEQQVDGAHNSTIVHVPLLIGRTKSTDAIDDRLEATAEIKRAQGVALLYTPARLENTRVVVD